MRFYEQFNIYAFIMKARVETLRDIGPALSPFNAFLFLQGLETLHVRMDRHVQNAQKIAEYLAAHPLVNWVNYPGLASSPDHALAQKYLPKGAGAIFCFGVTGGRETGKAFIESLEMISHLANVGDAKTLVIHPASTTHQQMSDEEQINAGLGPDLIRISIGLEDPADIIWDLNQALTKAAKLAAVSAGA
jgi:O-acetylhomoserine (thiol)-lyase